MIIIVATTDLKWMVITVHVKNNILQVVSKFVTTNIIVINIFINKPKSYHWEKDILKLKDNYPSAFSQG